MKIFELGCAKLYSTIMKDKLKEKRIPSTRTTLFLWRFIFCLYTFPYSVEYGFVIDFKFKYLNIMFYPIVFSLGYKKCLR
jgi:hypothetical protein